MIGSTAKMFESLSKGEPPAHANTNTENDGNPTCNPSLAPAPNPNELENVFKNMLGNSYQDDNTPMG